MMKYTEKVWPIIISATNKLVDFIKPTFGPAQNRILIQRGRIQEVIDDGVTTAEVFQLPDEFENSIVTLIKQVSKKTNDRVGDGTTSSLIILQAIINEMDKLEGCKARDIIEELQRGLEEVKKELTKKAKQISTKEELRRVAYIAFNNEKIADVIADTLMEVGHDGIVTIEESKSLETTHEIVKGLQFPKGFASPYFITDPQRAETSLDKPYILVTDRELVDGNEILPILTSVIKSGNRQLVLIADDIRGEALATLVVNVLKGNALFVGIRAPYHSNRKYEALFDIAELTGAQLISEGTGKSFETMTLDDLGMADSVVINKDTTTIVGGHGKSLDEYLMKLRALVESSDNELEKDRFKERIAKLTAGVAVIKVGGATEGEMKALRYKVEDAVNATKVAHKSGVVKGAGLSLANLKTSSPILNKALKYPHKQLLKNLEVDELEINSDVIDPVEVLIAGVESAVSIASILVTNKGLLVEEVEKKNEQE